MNGSDFAVGVELVLLVGDELAFAGSEVLLGVLLSFDGEVPVVGVGVGVDVGVVLGVVGGGGVWL